MGDNPTYPFTKVTKVTALPYGDRFEVIPDEVPNLPGPFSLKLPEVYQIELTSECNYACTMCPRKLYSRKDKTKFLSTDLVEKMCVRGDFDGSYFVELQMSGEPLLHPDLGTICNLIKNTSCLVGLSTNGHLFWDKEILGRLGNLDYITISLDSVTKRDKIRKGARPFDKWYEIVLRPAIYYLHDRGVKIDIQFIELDGWPDELAAWGKETGGYLRSLVKLRTVPDCFITKFEPVNESNEKGLCLNPFLSCSVQCNGDVVPCCFAWGDDIVYGNIKEQSLAEIWQGEAVKLLRDNHIKQVLPELCFQCYMRSPVLLHWQIFFDSLKEGRLNANSSPVAAAAPVR